MDSLVNVLSAFMHGTTTDNYVFRIHYKVTFTILIVFAGFVGLGFIGRPIKCNNRDYPESEINHACWMQSTFTLKEDWNKTAEEVLYPGVGSLTSDKTKIYHTYYKRVFLALCLQALFFYLPRCLWKKIEGGRIRQLTLALNSEFLPEDARESKKRFITEYLVSNMNNHQFYFACFALAEIMNFVNVVAQICFLDSFLGGDFSSKVINYRDQIWNVAAERSDPLIQTFPRMVMCVIRRQGASGSMQRHQFNCTLTMNSLNEKIFVFLWCWFVTLAVFSALTLVYRAVIVFYPRSRSMVTGLRVPILNQYYLAAIIGKCKLGDWLILDLLSRNLDPLSFRDVVNDFAQRIDVKNVYGNSFSLDTRISNVEHLVSNSASTTVDMVDT